MILHRKPKHADNGLRIVITGGVTGGHLFPGIALAEEFLSRDGNSRVKFISVGTALEKNTLARKGFDLWTLPVSGIKGRGLFARFKSIFSLPAALWQAMGMIKAFDPHLVVSVGSYSAGAATLSAWILRKKIVVCEQNIIPGITNRILARFANRIYVSFEESRGRFDAEKVRCFGNPVRSEFFVEAEKNHEKTVDATKALPCHENRFTILIVGGSQGAHNINMSVVEALGFLENKSRYQFVHQTGEQDAAMVQDAYDVHECNAEVRAFFNDMACRYKKADLIVCRSGATTVAELTAMGKPAVFIPFPHAADNHQYLNARSLAQAGAAEMIPEQELTGEVLADRIRYYESHSEVLAAMAQKSATFGHPEAARKIVADCYELLEENSPLMLLLNFIIKD
jgi:UDP-N-acetylglucosamine--N-acetylmuramyl-(pentapeptide) pyrophosphoryl-undecaprenol N-acetylglucosamine transferase